MGGNTPQIVERAVQGHGAGPQLSPGRGWDTSITVPDMPGIFLQQDATAAERHEGERRVPVEVVEGNHEMRAERERKSPSEQTTTDYAIGD